MDKCRILIYETTYLGEQMRNHNNTFKTISHWKNIQPILVLEGIGVGIFSGLVVIAFRLGLEKIGHYSNLIYTSLRKNHPLIPLWFLALAIFAYIVYRVIKTEPITKGSGIPQVEGVLLRQLDMNWWRLMIGKFIGGFLSLGAGLSLGREGPSIQLGAAAGQGIAKLLQRPKLEEKYLITGGASAGLSAAFNAPLAGVIFALEEVHKHFSPLVLLTAMSASLTADMVSKNFFGMKPILDFKLATIIPLRYYFYLIILGGILGLGGTLFNYSLLKTQEIYSGLKKVPDYIKMLISFFLAGILGILLPQVLAGGHELILSLTEKGMVFKVTLILLIVKFLFTLFSYGPGAPGGIFLPMLAIGALIGSIYGNLLSMFFQMDPIYINNLIVLSMAGYFTAIVRAPITGCILISEMTGSFNHLLSLAIVSTIAYIVADSLKSKPIYESLLMMMLKNKHPNQFVGDEKAKVLLEIAIQMGAVLDGKRIKDVEWPINCLLISIRRGNEDIIPNGNSEIFAGDYLIILVDEFHAPEANKALLTMANKMVLADNKS